MSHKLRVVVTLICLSLSIVAGSCAPASSSENQLLNGQAIVTEIVDGDTIVVMFGGGTVERVRLLGIDTPETSDPRRPVQCFGAEATEQLNELISPGSTVRLERDLEARDQYGRLLAYVFRSSDDLFVNEALVRGGYADTSFYEPNTAYQETLTHAATQARTSEAGLWLTCGGADVALDPDAYESN